MARVLFTAGVGSALTAPAVFDAAGVGLTRVHGRVGGHIQPVGVDQAAVAAAEKQREQERRAPHCFTQTKETRPSADSSTDFAMTGPAASQDFMLEKPGTEVIARTSAGKRKNQITSVHMGNS